ncbi:hypothetical protein [Sphingomonas sp. LR55]|uniref:hypothetical protein n=1 Tax=Sphingomonas sp. LR55 TaxID=3050231 RepID=UPI002FE1A622
MVERGELFPLQRRGARPADRLDRQPQPEKCQRGDGQQIEVTLRRAGRRQRQDRQRQRAGQHAHVGERGPHDHAGQEKERREHRRRRAGEAWLHAETQPAQAEHDERVEQHGAGDIEHGVLIAQHGEDEEQLQRSVEPMRDADRRRPARLEEQERKRGGERQAGEDRAPIRGAIASRGCQLDREQDEAEQPPAGDMRDPDHQADRHEDRGADEAAIQPQPQPQPKRDRGEHQRERQAVVEEAVVERHAEHERQRERCGRGGDNAPRATSSMPPPVSTAVAIMVSLVTRTMPKAGPNAAAIRSTPRLPESCQCVANHWCRYGDVSIRSTIV